MNLNPSRARRWRPRLLARVLVAAAAVAAFATPSLIAASDETPAPEAVQLIEWHLVAFEDPVRGVTEIDDPSLYTLQLLPDDRVAIRADCNRGMGSYTLDGAGLEFGPIATTLVACPPESLSDRYLEELSFVRSFAIDRSGASDQLVLGLMADGGFLRFEPTLLGVTWQWQAFEGGDGAIIAPDDPAQYTLTFADDGTMTALVDCNSGRGTYQVDGPSIEMVVAVTRKFCGEDSQDGFFMRLIDESNSFVIRDGRFALALPYDGGIASFAPVFVEPDAGATPEAETT